MNRWLREHPWTCVYAGLWLTALLIMQLVLIAQYGGMPF